MGGFSIFLHSVRMLTGNFQNAIKVSLPLLVSSVCLNVTGSDWMVNSVPTADVAGAKALEPSLLAPLFLLFWSVAGLWTVVSWHRFVLLEEYPRALPAFKGRQMLSYFLKSFLIGLILMLPMLLMVFASSFVTEIFPKIGTVLIFLTIPVSVWLFYRLSPMLVAAAIDKPMKVGEAWNATSKIGISALIAAVLILVLSTVLQLTGGVIFLVPVVGFLGPVLAETITALLLASLVTTIYGISCENRTL